MFGSATGLNPWESEFLLGFFARMGGHALLPSLADLLGMSAMLHCSADGEVVILSEGIGFSLFSSAA
ncbi:hypothetical protein Nepgr_009255 [Nepenthes gracilis]|uniref:Uncharacterized protein n=1 Tax=Nepenthes gracilis TaxID=150966 RepID=A0AAD3SA59_NEPGR|nr:hypothetical protein Nepgr_009255 [Nepenthes gracilis]